MSYKRNFFPGGKDSTEPRDVIRYDLRLKPGDRTGETSAFAFQVQGPDGVVSLDRWFSAVDFAAAYAVAHVWSEAEISDVRVRLADSVNDRLCGYCTITISTRRFFCRPAAVSSRVSGT